VENAWRIFLTFKLEKEREMMIIVYLVEGHESLCHGAASVVQRQLFPLNDFFSRTTRPVSTKLGKKHVWGMGI